MMTTIPVDTIRGITRKEAERLAATEYERVADQLRSLAADDWQQPTIDAVEFCRTLSGRASGAGLLNQEVPF